MRETKLHLALSSSETEMRERIRPRQRGATSRRSALNSAIKTPAHVYYFILVPGPPRLKRIHNYRCLREPLNLSRAPARTSLIYACVDFNSHAARSRQSAPHRALDCSCPQALSASRIPVPGAPGEELSASSCDELPIRPTRIQISRIGFRAPTGKRNRAAAHKSRGERAFHRTDLRSIASYAVVFLRCIPVIRV